MKGLSNYIYEVQRGTKPMALVTMELGDENAAVSKIEKSGLSYATQKLEGKVNIFFGQKPCIKIVEGFLGKKLCELTPQEDFMLGTMLGYCRIAQCERYLSKAVKVS